MDLTAAILKEAGYVTSNEVGQSLITRCANDIMQAYILPILPDFEFSEDAEDDVDVLNAYYCLTYILLLSRNVVKTRYGARQKEVEYSKQVAFEEIEQLTITADMYIQKLYTKEGAVQDAPIYDIAKIYNLNTLI